MQGSMAIERVLLVDDDASIRELAAMGLEGMTDWKVELASSGAEALDKANHSRPDVILLDLMMPGLDGLEVIARLRNDPAVAEVPVILMTAKVEPQESDRYRKAGFCGLITKPFDPVTLSEEIEQMVARHSQPDR
ncbi:MAG TPA: response regulator [Chroococcales cyanobacterium]